MRTWWRWRVVHRSLGDAVAHTAGVTSEPEIFERTINPEGHYFIIMATDGLWEFVSNMEAVALAATKKDPQQAVDALIREANDRWMREEQVIDDTTVCVAFLGNWAGSS
jgi:serine/threonine protein phosphatase PrpC